MQECVGVSVSGSVLKGVWVCVAENGKQIAERAQQNEGNTSAAALLLPTNT